MTRLLLLRHGRSEMNAEHRVQGWLDSPLDEVGRAQAQAVARRLRQEEMEVLYTSTLRRARETAEIITGVLNVPLVADERLRECDVGAIAGLNNKEIEARFPEWVQRWRETGGLAPPPGAEQPEVFWGRVVEAFDEIVGRHSGEVVGVVTHGGVLGTYLSHLVGVVRKGRSPFSLGNCSLSIVEFDTVGFRIRLVNDQYHLEGEKKS